MPIDPLRKPPPLWRQKGGPVAEEHQCRVVVDVTVWIDPTDELLVGYLHTKRHNSIDQIVRDEIYSNLESLSYVKRLSVQSPKREEGREMTVKFISNDKGGPAGKLADAELHFSGGPLDGMKLVGFAIWERRNAGRNVTFPARQYTVNGERRTFALLRPIVDTSGQDRLRDVILEAYKDHEAGQAAAS